MEMLRHQEAKLKDEKLEMGGQEISVAAALVSVVEKNCQLQARSS